MRTVVLDPPPAEFERLLERRHRVGADRGDEVWDGVLHMVPAPHFRHSDLVAQVLEYLGPPSRTAGLRRGADFNLGHADDYRVPDGGLLDPGPPRLYEPTARLVLEVLSPGDETIDKLPFYAGCHVDEILIVEPDQRRLRWLALDETGRYQPIGQSGVVAMSVDELTARIDWPG